MASTSSEQTSSSQLFTRLWLTACGFEMSQTHPVVVDASGTLCTVCGVSTTDRAGMAQHLAGKRHKNKMTQTTQQPSAPEQEDSPAAYFVEDACLKMAGEATRSSEANS